jgi:hypothetical protein
MSPVVGWYADPVTPGQLRYWSGEQWTTATQPAVPPMPPPAYQPPPVPQWPAPQPATPQRIAGGQQSDVWLPRQLVENGYLPMVCAFVTALPQ